jgi:hypothetical protein
MIENLGEVQIEIKHLDELAPFLSEKGLKRLIEHVSPSAFDPAAIVSLAPHLDRETLEALIRGTQSGQHG